MDTPTFSDYDIEAQFLQFLRDNDMYPIDNDNLILDGQLHRFRLEGDRAGETSGAYCIYTDGIPAGWAEDWHVGHSEKWHYDTSGLPREQRKYAKSPKTQAQVEEARKKREAEQAARYAAASDRARIRIETLPYAHENHPYLQAKQVFPYGAKQDTEGKLAIPIRDIDGNIKSLQNIYPNGDKRLYLGAPIEGYFWSIGLDMLKGHPTLSILIGEGFATMAKVHELTGLPCVAAISCSNMKAVAQALKGKYSNSKIICMADNDKGTELKRGRNPGLDAANELVKLGLAVDVVAPEFQSPDDGTDWDDFAIKFGDERTAKILKDKIAYALIPPNIKEIQKRTTIINAQDLRKKVFPPIKWAVDGFLPSGLSILAGGPKVGKSILALHLSIGVAIGGCVLGKINVQKGNVLYLALEDTQRRLQERINGGELAGDESVDLSNLDIITEIPRQDNGGLEYIRWWLTNHPEARLVVIDTLQMFRKKQSGKGSMYSEDYDVMSEIKKLADEFDVAFLIIHHLKKGMEGDWLSEISGSQGIAGAADTIFSLKRERNSTLGTFHRTGRDVEERDFIMKLDGYGWTLQDDAEMFTMPEWKRQIIDYLRDNGSITPMQLSEAYGLNINTAKSNLKRLLHEGILRKTGHGKYELES